METRIGARRGANSHWPFDQFKSCIPALALTIYSPAHPITLKLHPSRTRNGGRRRDPWGSFVGITARQQCRRENQNTKLFNHDGLLFWTLENGKMIGPARLEGPSLATQGERMIEQLHHRPDTRLCKRSKKEPGKQTDSWL